MSDSAAQPEASVTPPRKVIFPRCPPADELLYIFLEKLSEIVKVPVDSLVVSTTFCAVDTAHGISSRGFSQIKPPNNYPVPWTFLPNGIYVDISYGIENILVFHLSAFPGCCGVAVSHNAYTGAKRRNKGINTLVQQLRIDLARLAGYSYLLASDMEISTFSHRTMNKNGWEVLPSFTNRRTARKVTLRGIAL